MRIRGVKKWREIVIKCVFLFFDWGEPGDFGVVSSLVFLFDTPVLSSFSSFSPLY